MNRFDDQELDRMVEDALRDEPLRSAPAGMCRTISARLEIVKLIEHERHWLRYSFFLSAGLFTALIVAALFAVAFPQWSSLAFGDVPGGMGYCDYLLASNYAYVILAMLGAIPMVPLGATVILAFFPLQRKSFFLFAKKERSKEKR